jgi:NADPH-dependent glutamate synthase beta subunit-like oxidoreductase
MSVVAKKVAIVGARPAGFYTADALLRLADWIRIDLIDRLPIPFGLVRHGVAGDHLGTKSVVRVFERVMKQGRVRYFGNVEVGKSISWDDLQSCYDTVVIATGANEGCVVQIPGHDLYNSITAIDLMQWMNGHPDHPEVPFSGRPHSVVIIGNGNVSLDVARVFAKSDHELRQSDIPGSVLQVLDGHTVEDIHICGRRGLDEARFAPNELAELCRLSEARISISPDVAGLLRESAEPCARST